MGVLQKGKKIYKLAEIGGVITLGNQKYEPPKGFIERMEQKVDEKQITYKDLAQQCGVGVRTINDYRNGVTIPNITVLSKMCIVLDVSADYLLFGNNCKRGMTKSESVRACT